MTELELDSSTHELEVITSASEVSHVEGDIYINYIDDFVGATSSTAGEHGLVPAPVAAQTKSILFSDGIWWRLFNEMTSNGHLLLKRIRSTGGATPRPIIETIDDMPMQAASEYIPGLMTVADKMKLDNIDEMDALTSDELAAILV